METVMAVEDQVLRGKGPVPQAGQVRPAGAGLPMMKAKVKIGRKEK